MIFDLDGVLVDSRATITRSLNAALLAHDHPEIPAADLLRFIGPPIHAVFEELLAPWGHLDLVDSCVASYRAHYDAHLDATTVVEGIGPLLEELAGMLPLAVATSKPLPVAEVVLGTSGLARYFSAVAGPALEARNEPKSTTLARALATLGVTGPSATDVMVGDRYHDVEAALAQGVRPLGVTWGIGTEEELRVAGAETIVHHPAELVPLLLA
ncbi:MAG TPA: HAD hydrolase-like protein [Acidimicrobiales bacterium]|nr:HAD hydrolase-like protein [Acidimicrobiales bacterium]